MQDVKNNTNKHCVGLGLIWETSVLSVQLFCKSEIILKTKSIYTENSSKGFGLSFRMNRVAIDRLGENCRRTSLGDKLSSFWTCYLRYLLDLSGDIKKAVKHGEFELET